MTKLTDKDLTLIEFTLQEEIDQLRRCKEEGDDLDDEIKAAVATQKKIVKMMSGKKFTLPL